MKKLFITMLLITSAVSFASTGKVEKPKCIRQKETKTEKVFAYTCTVGDVKVDSYTCGCNPCARARAIYCAGLPVGTRGCN